MTKIIIHVTPQIDGYTFSILPSVRQQIRVRFPDACPANTISLAYDMNSGFQSQYHTLQDNVYLTLLGVRNGDVLFEKVKDVLFVNSRTGDILNYTQ